MHASYGLCLQGSPPGSDDVSSAVLTGAVPHTLHGHVHLVYNGKEKEIRV